MMDQLMSDFVESTTSIFEFLEKEFAYNKISELIEIDYGRGETDSIVRYLGDAVAVDIVWHRDVAVINVEFTELENGVFPERRYFWGNISGKPRAISLGALVLMKRGTLNDFLLGDMTQIGIAKINRRNEIIKNNMKAVLQNLKNMCLDYASEVINGDMSVFPIVVAYQQSLIDKQTSTL
jgi:hypothetical protein